MNPIKELKKYWLLALRKKDPVAYNMYLATVDVKGRPHVRTVLIKSIDKSGIGFVTHAHGRKVDQFAHSKIVEVCMAWPTLAVQARVTGKIKPMSKDLVKKLWTLRPRDAQILYSLGIAQSSKIPSFEYLLKKVSALSKKWSDKKNIPYSSNYTGFVVEPQSIEFLHHNPSRLNRRELWTRTAKSWSKTILAP
ncbi:MAG: pyridoxal 5'-phosphate synthase [Deltaproteobacteria bacterium]|nr:pyridoxal 5'-phosphate synthase [Deltaproteobacteria bacterium]